MTACSTPPIVLRTTPDDVVRQLRHLPSAPRVLPKLKRLLSDGNSSIHEIVLLVRLDPGIAARVLQVGNSAYFSQGMRCYTVEEAVQRVGYDQIYELVATAVASQVLVRPLEAYGIDADQLWLSSVAGALAAECLSVHIGIDQDIAYTIGLLHRIGMVAINDWITRVMPTVRFAQQELPLETCVSERSLLGFHNAEAGAALLRLWEFPPVMSEPVRWQYLPAATASHVRLASLLSVAKCIRHSLMYPNSRVMPEEAVMRRLNLSSSQLVKISDQARRRLTEVDSLLEMDDKSAMRISFPNAERVVGS